MIEYVICRKMMEMKKYNKEMKKYLKLSYELSKRHLQERLLFELEMNFELFKIKDNYNINALIFDCCLNTSFNDDEYQSIIKKVLKSYNNNHKKKLKSNGTYIYLC